MMGCNSRPAYLHVGISPVCQWVAGLNHVKKIKKKRGEDSLLHQPTVVVRWLHQLAIDVIHYACVHTSLLLNPQS